ncbi:MAG TPA: hypothetical protein VIJ70_03800, partial [Gaiellaceae bacterium]
GGGSGSLPLPKIAPASVSPPAGAVVDARQWGTRDLGLARNGDTATVTVVNDEGHGVDGLVLRIDGRTAAPCGSGCYRGHAAAGAVTVASGASTWRFALPRSAPSAQALIARAQRSYGQLRSVKLRQHLASGPSDAIETSFVFVAPDRLRYTISGGSEAIVIRNRRWDRSSPKGPWTRSPQQPVRVMHLPWDRVTNAHVVAPNTITFFDLNADAWFRVVLDPKTALPSTERMTGIGHFMANRYSGYNAPATIAAPPAVSGG